MIRSLLFLMALVFLTSCSSYKWVDTSDCKDRVNTLAKCRIIE